MSIINKMHQELKDSGDSAPMLVAMPKAKGTKKVILFCLILLLFISSITLSYLIYKKQSNNKDFLEETKITVEPMTSHAVDPVAQLKSEGQLKTVDVDKPKLVKQEEIKAPEVAQESNNQVALIEKPQLVKQEEIKAPEVAQESVNQIELVEKPKLVAQAEVIKVSEVAKESFKQLDVVVEKPQLVKQQEQIKAPEIVAERVKQFKVAKSKEAEQVEPIKALIQTVKEKVVVVEAPTTVAKQVQAPKVREEPKASDKVSAPYIEIKTSTLTKDQQADIYLQKAEKALSQGDLLLATKENNKALKVKPELHEVRKSLALYYYGQGDNERASSVLKIGAVSFPEYADFNLMLSRIALKNGDQQKAYLYLDQHPPKVKGNLDYHVSYAILAQKFKQYAKSENLYRGLLTQRPNNGRWMMSLAIAQDKQNKHVLAIESYKKALLQIDLSSKAKQYINQRLNYLQRQ
ncbi:tetratricopeptide repeat protein [Psychromonas sp. KJ10-10]|uniref:tetratricopeptide repeat protein n=1 Tax=Psychromonas sp. KJ10-10 TaxID=3391823 RepID=UPI0039B5617E